MLRTPLFNPLNRYLQSIEFYVENYNTIWWFLIEDLSRTTIRIYVYLLESKDPKGVREIARELNIPVSSVYYHLRRLEDLGVITRREGGYVVSKIIPLEGYVYIGRMLTPRLILYSLFFLGATASQIYNITMSSMITSDSILALILGLTAFVLFFFEGMSMRARLKSGSKDLERILRE